MWLITAVPTADPLQQQRWKRSIAGRIAGNEDSVKERDNRTSEHLKTEHVLTSQCLELPYYTYFPNKHLLRHDYTRGTTVSSVRRQAPTGACKTLMFPPHRKRRGCWPKSTSNFQILHLSFATDMHTVKTEWDDAPETLSSVPGTKWLQSQSWLLVAVARALLCLMVLNEIIWEHDGRILWEKEGQGNR